MPNGLYKIELQNFKLQTSGYLYGIFQKYDKPAPTAQQLLLGKTS